MPKNVKLLQKRLNEVLSDTVDNCPNVNELTDYTTTNHLHFDNPKESGKDHKQNKFELHEDKEKKTHRRALSNTKTRTRRNQVSSPLNLDKGSSPLLKLSQEPVFYQSQEDPSCFVRWDFGSPETVKQVKKWRGQYNADGVKKTVSYFNDAHIKPQKTSSSPTGFILHPQDLIALANKSKLQKAKDRVLKRKQHNVQEMVVSFLQDLTKVQQTGDEYTCASSSTVDDLTTNDSDHQTQITAADLKPVDEENCWSDDDLFQDNSLLIEATQNAEKCLNKANEYAFENKKNNNKSISEVKINILRDRSDLGSSDVSPKVTSPSYIPSSCSSTLASTSIRKPTVMTKLNPVSVTKQSNLASKGQATMTYSKANIKNVLNCSNINPTPSNNPCKATLSKASTEYSAKCAASVNQYVIQNSQSSRIDNPPPGSRIKSQFRKFSSFQRDYVSPTQKNTDLAVKPGLNTSLRKASSFDLSYSKSSQTSVSSQTSHSFKKVNSSSTPLSTDQIKPTSINADSLAFSGGFKTTSSNTAVTTLNKQTGHLSLYKDKLCQAKQKHSSNHVSDDGFDISLPEDVLQQLLEPDEILDSQIIPSTGTNSLSKNSYNVKTVTCVMNKKTTVPYVKEACEKNAVDIKMLKPPCIESLSETLLSPVKNVHLNKARTSPIQTFFKKTFSTKTSTLSLKSENSMAMVSSSTPVKIKNSLATNHQGQEGASDSFMENAFDDSFMDEALYESQILPMLIHAESETLKDTQMEDDKVTSCPSSPIKCSPEEIERKRQAAIQKRSKHS
ncbi:uncharacterized protein LOC131945213 [Physella acuta]|uniref:uncharacterized protein LOC131945213 n=1 Tax=Physella acuta TaxID=109671 RepID=UPI0027DB6F57|nr:uncharacterized protein LOC131945213 [Physella acuta]